VTAGDLKQWTLSDEIKTITSASEHLLALLPETRREIMEALDFASDLHERLPQEPPTFGHSDFKSDHLMAGPAGLTIIDFDTSSLTDPAFDVGKFLADLDWWHTLYERPCVQDAHAQFLKMYSQGVPESRLARARLYEALVLMRIAVRRVPLNSKNWAELTERLISQASEVLRSL
jgi:aminoglycoside phosphotransferase (APT) family kinase protein